MYVKTLKKFLKKDLHLKKICVIMLICITVVLCRQHILTVMNT